MPVRRKKKLKTLRDHARFWDRNLATELIPRDVLWDCTDGTPSRSLSNYIGRQGVSMFTTLAEKIIDRGGFDIKPIAYQNNLKEKLLRFIYQMAINNEITQDIQIKIDEIDVIMQLQKMDLGIIS